MRHLNAFTLTLAVLLTFSLVANSSAETVFVDASVADSGNGRLNSPYKTIAEGLSHPGLMLSDTIRIRGGTGSLPIVYLEENLQVDVFGITITNWESDSWRPLIVGTRNPNDANPDPAIRPDGMTISASLINVSNLLFWRHRNAGIAVRLPGGGIATPAQMLFEIQISNCVTFDTGSPTRTFAD